MKRQTIQPRTNKALFGKLGGAVFLMATSAIGPGFITQTTVFTQQLFTSFGFVILVSILLDIVVQLNIWQVIGASGLPAVTLSNQVYPGLGFILIILVSAGGLIFNIGNIGGCGMGINVLFGTDVKTGAMLSCLLAIALFIFREFGKLMDAFTKLLALLMLALTLYTTIHTSPPVTQVLKHSILPGKISLIAIVTLVGGTVGGYISFAGANRMLDILQPDAPDLRQVKNAAVAGILVAGMMRVLLFLATIGIVASGVILNSKNPAASVFEASAGIIGLKIFGVVLWCAAISSVVGAAYTSVSFLQHLHPFIHQNRRWFIIAFMLLSTLVFVLAGNPVSILVKAGAINGFVLPFSLTVILVAAGKKTLFKNYQHPLWLKITGWMIVLLMSAMSIRVAFAIF